MCRKLAWKHISLQFISFPSKTIWEYVNIHKKKFKKPSSLYLIDFKTFNAASGSYSFQLLLQKASDLKKILP